MSDQRAGLCVCGHPRTEHHGEPGRGPCMYATGDDAWSCACDEYQERDDWLDWEDE